MQSRNEESFTRKALWFLAICVLTVLFFIGAVGVIRADELPRLPESETIEIGEKFTTNGIFVCWSLASVSDMVTLLEKGEDSTFGGRAFAYFHNG